jgi:hypothetical protein
MKDGGAQCEPAYSSAARAARSTATVRATPPSISTE